MGIFGKLFNLNVKSDAEENTSVNSYSGTTVSNNISQTQSFSDFYMVVEDVFSITGRGTVVTGRVAEGEIHVGDTVCINERITSVVTGIEQFRAKKDYAVAGENIGLLLSNVSKNDIHQGDSITKQTTQN